MTYLLLTIICSSCLMLVFKLIGQLNIKTFPVVVINYMVCAIIGISLHGSIPDVGEIVTKPWFPFAIVLGTLFVTVFYMVGLTTRLNGITAATIAFKLSLAIPVVAAFVLYNDSLGMLKLGGIALSIPAIYLSTKSESKGEKSNKRLLILPAIVFLGSGATDTVFNYVQQTHLDDADKNVFLLTLFFTASSIGLIALIYNLITGNMVVTMKKVGAGILLGLPNYGSVYFMYKTLEFSGIESSSIWPMNNIGIIILSSLMAMLIFKEKVTLINGLGIGIAVISILLISFSA